jgi:hypothetical protein
MRVFSPTWPRSAIVVVLHATASLAEQVAGTLDAEHVRVLERVRQAFGFTDEECIGDTLVACGLGEAQPDDAASCSHRFVEHERRGAMPAVVVLLGDEAARLATAAGLGGAGAWTVLGASPQPRLEMAATVDDVVECVGRALGRVPIAPTEPAAGREEAAHLARALMICLGDAAGHRQWGPKHDHWKSFPRQKLRVQHVRRHLSGELLAGVLHPRGPWPFVVIDLDRHSAVQELHFDRTLRAVQDLFPHALTVESSASRGAHVYVPLPPDASYEDGALWLAAFLELRGLRFRTDTGDQPERPRRGQLVATSRELRTQLVEVPSQPPRLPFGRGSHIWGDVRPLTAQITTFATFVSVRDASDFIAARDAVVKARAFSARSVSRARRHLENYLVQAEAGTLRLTAAASATDPWGAILPRLPAPLRGVALSGTPAYGTRTRWTIRLIRALTEVVGEKQAEALMLEWVRSRHHVSRGVELDPVEVERQTRELVEETYAAFHGVPERFWVRIETLVRHGYRDAQNATWREKYRKFTGPPAFAEDDAVATAFCIARRFYNRRQIELTVSHRWFGRIAGKNHARQMQVLLTAGPRWLVWCAPAVTGVQSRRFALLPDFWPPRRREPCRFAWP